MRLTTVLAGALVALAPSPSCAQVQPGLPSANTFYAGPTSGQAAPPTFRPLSPGDFPAAPGIIANPNLANMAGAGLKGATAAGPVADLTGAQAESILQFTQSGTGATQRTLDGKIREIFSVTDFGAVGDGVTNNYTAIQNALNAGAGNRVYLPAGAFAVTLPAATPLATVGANTVVEGAGKNTTVLKITPTGTSLVTAFPLSNPHIVFRNLTIQLPGDSTGTQQAVLFGLQASDLKFQNVALVSNAVEGVLIGGSATNGDTVKVIFTSTALAGSPITISSTVTTGQTTAQIASGLASAINANGTISGAGIVASAAGSFVSVSQPDTLIPQASYTTQVTGSVTETMTIGSSVLSIVWNVPQQSTEVNDFLAENADVMVWNYALLKANATTTTNRRFTFRSGYYTQNITGAANINSPSGTFDRLVIEGLHIGSVGLNNANDLPIALSNVSNATIIGNVLEGTYQQNAMHFEENVTSLTVAGNVVQGTTSSSLGTGYNGTCMFFVDNNVGGLGFRPNNDVMIIGNDCRNGSANISGYGIFASFTSVVNQRWTVMGNTFTGFAGGINSNIGGFNIEGNTLTAFSAAGTGITVGAASQRGVVSGNIVQTYTTGISNLSGTANFVIRDNIGYNPVGPASISVGASPFIYTAGASPETVYVSGGTVSSVTFDKNGGTLTTIACSASPCVVELGPFEQSKVTYTAAPTMNKMIH